MGALRYFQWMFLFLVVTVVFFTSIQLSLRILLPRRIVLQTTSSLLTGNNSFFVRTPNCTIIRMDPFDPSVQIHFAIKHTPVMCSNRIPLTYVVPPDEPEGSWKLKIDAQAISKYVPRGYRMKCCFLSVRRPILPTNISLKHFIPDFSYIETMCTPFHEHIILHQEKEFVVVQCSSYKKIPNHLPREIYKNMHALTPLKPELKKRLIKRDSPQDEKLNVLMIVFDSMSQLNLLRTMPQTVKYLNNAGFINFWGYTKIGDNSYPNSMAFLAGLNIKENASCWIDSKGGVDSCPFIWKDFQKEGYATAYVEDESLISTFNTARGFWKQPMDYHNRPYILASYDMLPVKKSRDGLVMCMGPKSQTDHALDYLLNFLFTFRNHFHFSLTWLSNFSHGILSQPLAMDKRIAELLDELRELGVYNKSLVMFMSDHGPRFGSILQTEQGWYESRMPYLYLSLPEWWKLEHPKQYNHLINNQNKLISPYDVHLTVKDILNMGRRNISHKGEESLACPKCRSLMSADFGDRTCSDAGIPSEYCTCSKFEDVNIDEVVYNLVEFVIAELHKIVRNMFVCKKPYLNKILKAQRIINEWNPEEVYLVTFNVLPENALFQAAVKQGSTSTIQGNIHRIDEYRLTGYCVKDRKLQMYCICRHFY